jgi:predicted dehydrogenase
MVTDTRPLKIAVIGAGIRGTNLARKVVTSGLPAVITAVAEPDPNKRNSFQSEFSLGDKDAFRTWEELIDRNITCDAVIIATLDNQHAEPALMALDNDWHILIEKPLADTYGACRDIVRKQKEKKKTIAVCHTLRFMEGYRKVWSLIREGAVGQIVHIEHMEAISNIRFAHNYVRSRWSQEKLNTFLLLHKCSHDIDFLAWIINERCLRTSSFGSLKFFTTANAPEGSTKKCTDGCRVAESCPYNAVKLYVKSPLEEWPARDASVIHTREAHLEAIKNGPLGNCVWKGENDVVDHQAVMMEFENGTTATCTLTGYSATNGRRIRIQGTKGELLFDEAAGTISIREFHGGRIEMLVINPSASYHPEDQDIVNEWLNSVINKGSVTVDADEALRTHAIVFAAELSRKEGRTIDMKDFYGDLTK